MDPNEPVYYANRSTCLFELGEYAASCEDSKQATMLYRDKQKIGMISRAEANAAIGRLLRQSARCFLCMNTSEGLEAAKSLLARCIELHPDPDPELLSMHSGAIQGVEEAYSAGAGEGSGPGFYMVKEATATGNASTGVGGGSCDYLPRYRSPVVNLPTPYSCIGWECALSGLAGRVPSPADTESPFSAHGGTFGEDEDDGSIDLLARPEGERHLSLLFGGLGDARQPLATFRDIHQQVANSGGRLDYRGMSLSLILNDVKAECLTRAVVMFKALAELGATLKQAAAAKGGVEGGAIDVLELLDHSDEVALAVYRCYHLYLGAFLMPHEADWLQAALDEMSSNSKNAEASESSLGISWLTLTTAKDRQAVKGVIERWRIMCKTMDPQLMAHIYQSSMQRPMEEEEPHHEHNGHSESCGDSDPEAMEEACVSLEQQWRAQVREAMLEQIETMDDEEIDLMQEAQGQTPEEKRTFLRDHWTKDVDPRTLDLMRHLPAAHREIEFFHTTMLLPVPPPVCARGHGLMDKAHGRSLHQAWRPNVTLVSADTPLEAMVPGKLEEDPALSASLTALHFCPFKALKLLLMTPGDENFLSRQEVYRSAAIFFSEVALGLAGFLEADTLKVEMFLGDVHDLGSTQAPESLDRVLISNVPDYTTLLPSMIKLTPLLKATQGAALKHSVLKFNANFQDLPEYAHSMGLYVPDMASLPVYLGVNHEYGGIWAHLVEWSRSPPIMEDEDGNVTPPGGGSSPQRMQQRMQELEEEQVAEEQRTPSPPHPMTKQLTNPDKPAPQQHLPPAPDVQAWLATVFLSIAMPLCRDAVHAHTEIRPLTLQAFFELCHYLVVRMDFPPHNLAWVIEHAMLGELNTSAVPPDATPWSPHFTWRQHQLTRSVPTGAFSLETRTLAGLWQRKLGFRLCAPTGLKLPQPEDVTQLRLTLPVSGEEARLKATGVCLAKVVGVALVSPDFMAAHAEALDPSNHHAPLPRHGSSVSLAASLGSSPGSDFKEPEDKGLRPFFLERETQKSGNVHLFSCVRWDSQSSLVMLLLPKADLRELVAKDYHLLLIRTDSWHPLTKPFPLSDGASLQEDMLVQQEEAAAGASAMEVDVAGAATGSSSSNVYSTPGSASAAHGQMDDDGHQYSMQKTRTC